MSINKPLFKKIYSECCAIIETSEDKNIKLKMDKLKSAYNELCRKQDCELQEFYSIVHELRTYQYLKILGINTVAQNDNLAGPDFNSDIGYIECVSVTKGKIGTAERQFLDAQLAGIMNRYLSALPRITSAIFDKKKKFSDYLNKNILSSDKPLIIAVNTSIFSNEFHSDLIINLTLKILYGVGAQSLPYNLATNSFVEQNGFQTHIFDERGKKSVDKELSLNYFALDDFRIISAIIMVNNSIGENLNNKYFNIFINPNAINCVDLQKIGNARYFDIYKADNNYLYYKWYNQE